MCLRLVVRLMKPFDIGVINAKGRGKDNNEDYHLVTSKNLLNNSTAYLFAVADGMGGYENAEIASHRVIGELEQLWHSYTTKAPTRERLIEKFNNDFNTELESWNQIFIDDGEKENTKHGTTLSVIFIVDKFYMIYHIGDGRIYKFVSEYTNSDATIDLTMTKGLHQLTKDHSWVQEKIDANEITEEEAQNHKHANIVTQCIGVSGEIDPFKVHGTLHESDLFLLTTDGIFKTLNNHSLEMLIKNNKEKSSQQICEIIFEEVKNGKFSDDVCIIIFKL